MKHRFQLDEDGKIDIFAMESDIHNGPHCTRCEMSWCQHCTPNCFEEECPGDRYQRMGQLSLFEEIAP